MTPESAEMTKYVANCMLATKISFINEMANLCEHYDADINDVRRGIGHDSRIGFHFLHPGVGYGGSCFPKDIRAVIHMARTQGASSRMMEAVDAVNEAQKNVLVRKILDHFDGEARGKTVAIWGLAFKPKTDDIREAPALVLIDALLEAGVAVRVHDPEALANVRALYGERADLLRPPLRRAGAGRRPGDRDGVEGVPQPGLRGDDPPDAPAGHLRRPQPLRAGPDGRPRLRLSRRRPAPGPRGGRRRGPTPRRSAAPTDIESPG
jgi:hypothetical protein